MYGTNVSRAFWESDDSCPDFSVTHILIVLAIGCYCWHYILTITIKMEDHPSTYIAGEDDSRLAQAALDLGLEEENARIPLPNIRFLQDFFSDTTLETARMHSVGALGNNEHIDKYGNVHMTLTVTRRRRKQRPQPDYGDDLANLFQQGPLPEDDEDDDEEEVEEEIDVVEGGSMTAAVFGIIKATIGSAVLFLPRGFQLAGYAVAIPAMMMATASYIYSANRLLQCWQAEKEKATKIDEIRTLLLDSPKDYGSVSKEQESSGKLLTYPELARRAFGGASVLVQLGVALMQFGVCLTYLIFVPQNLYEATRELFGWEVDKTVFLISMVLVEIPLSWIRDIRKLTPYNVLATFLTAYGLISCLVIAFWEIGKDPDSTYFDRVAALPPAKYETWFLFIGTAVSERWSFS
jgi:proton-coupled amino acid transporter